MRRGWLAAGTGLWFSIVLSAQVRVTGKVTNDTNAPVANASVTVRTTAEPKMRLNAYTDPAGLFVLQIPNAGDYLLDAEASGFYPQKDKPITVDASVQEISITLVPVREFSEAADVTASASSIALDETATEQRLSGSDVIDIPFPVTHNIKNAMRGLPGVVQDNDNGIHLNGGAENQTLYLLNGFNIGDPLTMRFDTRLSVEAIQSMETQSGAVTAEYGKGSAGVINVNTRTGDDRIRYSATNFIPGVENQKGLRIGSWNPRVNVSGPIRRGRVWFSDSFASQYDQTVIRELPPGQDVASSIRFNNFLHVQANLTPTNIMTFGFLASVWRASRTGLGALDPPPTTADRRSQQFFGYAKDQMFFGRGAVAEIGFASNRTMLRTLPQGTGIYIFTPFGRSGNYFINGWQDAQRDQIIANYVAPTFTWLGSHLVKIGTDLDRLWYSQNIRRTGFEYLNADNSPIRTVYYAGSGRLWRNNLETSMYVQDSWRVRPSVLVELGLRSDWDRLLGNWTASPRAGVAWTPKWSESTRFSAGYAISYDATDVGLFARALDQYTVTTYYPPYGDVSQPVRSLFEIGAQRFRSPRFTTINFAADHRFGSNIYARMQALRRRGENGLAYEGVWNDKAVTDLVYQLANSRSDSYDAVELTMRQNFHREYSWMASYTRSHARSTSAVDLTQDTAMLIEKNAGRLSWDAPNRFVSWAYLPTGLKNWAVAYLFEYHSGFPFSVQNQAGEAVGPVNSISYPAFFELNLHIERRFQYRGQRWAIRMGANNITGHSNPNGVNNIIDSPQYLTYYGGQSRALNFRIRWLGKI
jgi:outer membrane receptor for ferrienterochelin and colicin